MFHPDNQDKASGSKNEALILVGSAGSGKSTVLQNMFLEAVRSWKVGDSIPIFVNLVMKQDLENYWQELKNSLNIHLEFEDLIKLPLILYLDSIDESRKDFRIIRNMFNSLASYSNRNNIQMTVTCRTGYFNEEKEEKTLKGKATLNFRYIIPLNINIKKF